MKTSTLAVLTEAEAKETVQPTDVAAEPPPGISKAEPHPSVGTSHADAGPNIVSESLARVDWAAVAASWGLRLLSLAVGVVIWHVMCAIKFKFFINFENVPAPLVVLNALIGHLHDSKFYIHIIVSIKRILIGFALATALGICLGVLMGRSRIARDFVTPYIEILRPIPAVAWIPLAILMWPTEESSIVYITFLGALFPIVLNTVHGVEQTPEVLVRAAQSLGASSLQIFWHVVMPAALPSIATGLAIGMGVSWFSLLAGEIISGQYGIGYFTWNAYSLINYPDIVVGMLVIGGLGTLSTQAVRKLTQPLLSWQRKSR
jgi:NitT/TauT family transport system permease protein